ncbi:MAG: hypothetical protein K0R18_2877 [Bacillales bacterium]|nr:hypothetical protein [Bacillales bacterium]
MLFLHDVWVNWFEGEENGYNVCYFHEWRKEDSVELLDQVPVLKIEPKLFTYIENDMMEIPKELLDKVHNQAYMRKNHERIPLEYCFIVTDGSNVIAIDTMGYSIPLRKSRLILRQEHQVFDLVDIEEEFKVTTNLKIRQLNDYHLLSPAPDLMWGLTRKERQLKQVLFMALDSLFSTKNLSELKYWYTEWNPQVYNTLVNVDFENTWNLFFNEISQGWTDRHEELTEKIIKGQTYLERIWELEQGSKVN